MQGITHRKDNLLSMARRNCAVYRLTSGAIWSYKVLKNSEFLANECVTMIAGIL